MPQSNGMKRIAQIMYGRVHHVFEALEVPDWPPLQDGTKPLLLDVTGQNINEGDGYNPIMGECVPRPNVEFNEETYEHDIFIAPETDVTGIRS